MAITDRIKRFGISGKTIVTGPDLLQGPQPGDLRSDFFRLSGLYGNIDRYEIKGIGGLAAGDYTITLKPYSSSGFTSNHRAVGEMAIFRQIDGVNTPAAAVTCLARRKPSTGHAPLSLGPFTAASGDRLWAVVEKRDQTTLKYQLEVDAVLA